MSKRALNLLSLGLLLSACLPVGARVIEYAFAVPSLTVTMPQPINDPLDPDMEIEDDGTIDPAFLAWAIHQLRETR